MKRLTVLLSVAALAGVLRAAQGVDPATLPPGAEREMLFRVCGECHDVENATAERLPPAEWRSVADDMVRRGAQVTEDEIKTLVRYLSIHVGRVDVNRASADDLKTVLELSKEQADAIVAFRTGHREFHAIDEVKKVPGIDGRAIEERKDRIVFSGQ